MLSCLQFIQELEHFDGAQKKSFDIGSYDDEIAYARNSKTLLVVNVELEHVSLASTVISFAKPRYPYFCIS